MSAREIIRQIEVLPPEEQRELFEFLKKAQESSGPKVRRASVEEVEEVANRVFAEHDELFRKLAS